MITLGIIGPWQLLLFAPLAIGALALYFLPTLIALKKKDILGVFLVNLFFGATIIGWIIALIWASSSPPRGTLYKCSNCGLEKTFESNLTMFKCPNCGMEEIIG